MKPTVGRIVHFYPDSRDEEARENYTEFVPAIITQVFNAEEGLVNLRVFQDGEKVLWRTSILHRDHIIGEDVPHWVWPPRE